MTWPNSLIRVDVLIAEGTQSVFHLKVVFKLYQFHPLNFCHLSTLLLIAVPRILEVPEKVISPNINVLGGGSGGREHTC